MKQRDKRDLVHQLGYIIVCIRGEVARRFHATRADTREIWIHPAVSRATCGTGSGTDLTRAGANLRRSALRYATSARTLKAFPWTHCDLLPFSEREFVAQERHVIAPVSRFYRDRSRDGYSRTSGPNKTYDL